MKRIIFAALISCFFMFNSIEAFPATYYELGVEEKLDIDDIAITVDGSDVIASGAKGKSLEIISLTGKHIAKIKIDSDSQRVQLNITKGCYILKIGNVVRKVSIQ